MRSTWQLHVAKNKLASLIERAQNEGPQFITKHGKEAVVVLSMEHYHKTIKSKTNLVDFLRESPLYRQELDFAS